MSIECKVRVGKVICDKILYKSKKKGYYEIVMITNIDFKEVYYEQ